MEGQMAETTKVKVEEALSAIESGHTIWTPEYAQMVCESLGIPFSPKLVQRFYSEPEDYKGARMKEGCEGAKGVFSLDLSAYCAEQFRVVEKAQSFFGRGSQAREYARLVRAELERQGKLKSPEVKES